MTLPAPRAPSGFRPNGGARRRGRGCAIITGSRTRPGGASGFFARAWSATGAAGRPCGSSTGCSDERYSSQGARLMPEITTIARKRLVREGGPVADIRPGELRRTGGGDALFVPARGVGFDRAGADRTGNGDGRDRGRRPQHAGGGGADAQRGQGRGAAAADRVPDRPGRCAERCSLIRATARLMGGCRNCSAWARCGRAKGECDLKLSEVALHAEGIALIAMPGEDVDAFAAAFPALCAALARDAPCRGGASLSRRRPGADRARSTGWRGRMGGRSSPPTTSIITSPSGGRCRT